MAKHSTSTTPQLLIQKVAQEQGISEDQFVGGMLATGKVKSQITAKKLWSGDPNTSLLTVFTCAEVLGVPPGKLLPGC